MKISHVSLTVRQTARHYPVIKSEAGFVVLADSGKAMFHSVQEGASSLGHYQSH